MKDKYIWNYNIKVRTKKGEYQYERETLEKIDDILEKHPDYDVVHAVYTKKLVKERNNGRKITKNN
jgi:hypothetical protein